MYAFICKQAGGYRISDINISSPRGGETLMRSTSNDGCLATILAAEDFLRYFHVKPWRPGGWSREINEFADAKDKLLHTGKAQ